MTGIALRQAAGPELALGRLGLGRLPCVGLGPFLPGRVGHGQPGQVCGGVPRLGLSLGLRFRVLVTSGNVSADLGVFQLRRPLVDDRLDVGRSQGDGPVVLVDGGLELALPHRLQEGRVIGECQRRHGRAERLPHLGCPGRRRADRLRRVRDPGSVPVGLDQARRGAASRPAAPPAQPGGRPTLRAPTAAA